MISGNNTSRVFYMSNSANLTLNNVTVTKGNGGGATNNGNLGGIFNDTNGTLTLISTTVTGNTAGAGSGGGIYSFGTVTLTNSTVSNNTAGSNGGGVRITTGGSLTATNSTISFNTANNLGGGINNAATVNLVNSIVAKNTNANAPDFNGAVSATSSNNLIGDGTNTTGITNGTNGNQVGTSGAPIDAKLAPLSNNGGLTQTFALLTGSPAINNGTATGAPTTDQRGAARRGTTDIGAFELNNTTNGGTFRAINIGRISTPFNYQLTSDSGAFTYSVTAGSLPPGLSLSNSFIAAGAYSIQGTPTMTGSYNYTITASDGTSSIATDYTTVVQTTTAASASVSGRVLTESGRGLLNATVILTDQNGVTRYAQTNLGGRFDFAGVASGAIYFVTVQSKRYQFDVQAFYFTGDSSDLVFRAIR